MRSHDERLPHEDFEVEAKHVRQLNHSLRTNPFDQPPNGLLIRLSPPQSQQVHPEYSPADFRNDVSVVRLARDVVFKEHIVPVCLPRYRESFVGEYGKVIGWGRTQHGE